MSKTAAIVEFALSFNCADVPADVNQTAKHALLDVVSCGLAGANQDAILLLAEEAVLEGGRAEAALLGRHIKVTRLQAARVNAAASHILDFDDSAEIANSHLSSPIAHAVLALGQSMRTSGNEVLLAYIAGYEAACRIAQACHVTEAYRRGWHATPVVGTLGAAIGCSRLLGQDAQTLAQAIGIAATQASGLKSMFGTMCKSFHTGEAASRGMRSALLAGLGLTSCKNVLEAPLGYAWCFSGQLPETGNTETDKGTWHLRRNLFKFHAACHLTHSFIESAFDLRERYALEPNQIERVTLHASPACLDVCHITDPQNGLEGKFSLTHTVAQSLHGMDTGDIALFSDANVNHSGLKTLRSRISIVTEEHRPRLSGRVDIRTRDGRSVSAEAMTSVNPSQEESHARVRAKFDTLTRPILGATTSEQLRDNILRLNQLASVTSLLDLAAARD